MQALLTVEARAASRSYHLLSEDGTRNLCGAVNTKSQFASDMHRVLTQGQAEDSGFDICGRARRLRTRRTAFERLRKFTTKER